MRQTGMALIKFQYPDGTVISEELWNAKETWFFKVGLEVVTHTGVTVTIRSVDNVMWGRLVTVEPK